MTLLIGLVGALGGVVGAVKEVVEKKSSSLGDLKEALEKVIDVVLEVVNKLVTGVEKKENALKNGKKEAQEALGKAQTALTAAKKDLGNGNGQLQDAKENLESLSKDGKGLLQEMWEALGTLQGGKEQSLKDFIDVSGGQLQVDSGKNTVSEFIHMVQKAFGQQIIKTPIDHLAQGLQKWVGWEEGDNCCLKGENGIGKKCDCSNTGGATCCTSGKPCHECTKCGTSANAGADKKCYQSAYKKESALWTTIVHGTPGSAGGSGSVGSAVGGKGGSAVTVDPVKAAQEVHLLARIFLGSVCLIWSGLSQLGWLTKGGGNRWETSKLHEESANLGSFMAAMGYDLERLNQGSGGKYCLGWSSKRDK